MQVLNALHKKIKENPKAHTIKVSDKIAKEYYEYLNDYHLNPVPDFSELKGKMVFLGRKLEIYEASPKKN